MKDIHANEDIGTVRRQLESENVSIRNVIERCRHGYPQIVLLNPLENADNKSGLNYQSVINILLLTCPYLNRRIHELENNKFIKRIEEFINRDPGLMLKMRNAHACYYFLRKTLCRCSDISAADNNDLFIKGIGGIMNLRTLKCLHLHYAHSRICNDNIAGKIVFHLLDGKICCDEIICRITERYDSFQRS